MKRSSCAHLVQAALEAVAEQRAERLALAHAVEQPARVAHPPRRQIDRERPVGMRHAVVPEVGVAQQRRGRRMRHRRRVDEAAVVGLREQRPASPGGGVTGLAPSGWGLRFSTQP